MTPQERIAKAVAAKKTEAESNRKRIRQAMTALSRSGHDITVRGVAREAGVSVDTVRRSGDLYVELQRLRASPKPKQVVLPSTAHRASETAMKARWLAAQAEVKELREELAATRRALHQSLGETGTVLDPDEVEQLRQAHAELTVAVMDLQAQVTSLRDERQELSGELLAANELNRNYVRELTQVRSRLTEIETTAVTQRSVGV